MWALAVSPSWGLALVSRLEGRPGLRQGHLAKEALPHGPYPSPCGPHGRSRHLPCARQVPASPQPGN